MASQADTEQPSVPTGRRIGCWASLAMLFLLAAGFALLWFNRERIAENVIADELAKRGIEATYVIEQIGPRREVLRDVVVGDPRRPDLTIERAEVTIRYRLGYPRIARLRLVRPRLFATWRDGELSFGALDPLIFPEEEEEAPFELPDFVLSLEDGRALLESDYGPVGVSFEGAGHLRGGFVGALAAIAPRLSVAGCEAERATLYGRVSVEARRPGFAGPLRMARLDCPGERIELADAALQLDGRADRALASVEGNASLRTARSAWGRNELAALSGTARFTWRESGLTARYALQGSELSAPQVAVGRLAVEGLLRARRGFERVELESSLAGEGVRLGSDIDTALGDAAATAGDTLLGPIMRQIRSRFAAEARGSRLAAELTLRRSGAQTSLVVPSARLRGGSGATLLSLSSFQLAMSGSDAPRYRGSFATGGDGLPRIAGRMEPRPGGRVAVRLSLAEYAAGASRLAVPELVLLQRPDGALGFAGEVRASGALPGGRAEGLILPLSGNWSPARGLALWNACTELRFERLQFANLALDRRRLTLCPPSGSAMLRHDARGLRIAAGAPSLELRGRLGETPIAIDSGPVGFAYPGALSARRLLVSLGPAGTATTFAIDDLTAEVGNDIAGRFAGADVRLYSVPLDLVAASGDWRYAGGRLTLSDGAFRLVDRQQPPRFEPLVAEGATLALENNLIVAEAVMREPAGGRRIVELDLRHDLATGRGHADLAVPGILFDARLQPIELTELAFGVVADARGTVTGSGRIDWDEDSVTSSGRFSSEALDFSAAFGPVRGASGTIVFTDLLGLTTAPNQRLRVASINPGIEVTDGEVAIEIRRGEVLALRGGTWPFMGGTLTLRPVDINLGEAERRRYVLEIVGLEAARFVERMELNNMAATGVFDGTVPLVFDEDGNGRLEGGLLLSRSPGGNVSYVGQLTYEDLGAVANMAFAALRSLDYRQMRVAMDGDLTGEIVTRVRMDGVSQGEGAMRNIATRALAGLPIRVDVNVTAPFYSLLGSIRALYDPAAIRDPRELGLLDAEGNPIRRETDGSLPPAEPDLLPDDSIIQRRESEETP